MKKLQIRKAIFIFAASLAFALNANAQLLDVSDYYDSETGKFMYTDNNTLGKQRRVNSIDNIESSSLDGKHWTGDVITGGAGQNYTGVYLVNKATGEYFVLGDAWGTTPMTDYTGTKFDLIGGKTCRADNLAALNSFQVNGDDPQLGTKSERAGKGFFIQLSSNSERCIGRRQTASGYAGSFEERPYMNFRSTQRKEYTQHPNDGYSGAPKNNDDGHMIFYFHPVVQDGKQYYVIYTHRQTTGPVHDGFYNGLGSDVDLANNWRKTIEYGNRDSYLCLQSQLSENGDYNIIRYKKFAGRMRYDSNETYFFEYFDKAATSNFTRNPKSTSTTNIVGTGFGARGDELLYSDKDVALETGLTAVKADDNCLWKVVTAEERLKYRTAASKSHPVDMSFLINNHKFYTFYRPYETGGLNDDTAPNFGWEWHNNETTADMHTHPYTSATGTEFHKIGTNFYDRWGWGEATAGTNNCYLRAKTNECTMTQGEEGNFVGSIFSGSAALRQTITGLRPGNYIVYCRAFFAPYDMSKFDNKEGWGTYGHNGTEYTGEFTNVGNPTFNGNAIDATVQGVIDKQPLSDNSFLFAIGKNGVERKRDVPSIFCGMMPLDYAHLHGMTKNMFAHIYYNQQFKYTPMGERLYNGETDNSQIGHTYAEEHDLLVDETVFAKVSYQEENYFVPRNLVGAARFFTAYDRTKHENAFNYRIGVPVEVGSDGKLTIGIDHIKGENAEWVCFDNFELVYYGVNDHWEFVCDQDNPKNNSIKEDFFGWSEGANLPTDEDTGVKADVIIKRGLSTEKYVSLILPVNLTKKQAKQAFGDGVKITFPSRLGGKTIFLDALDLTKLGDDDIAMHAGVPYAVKPSAEPAIAENKTWERTEYAADLSPWDVEGWDATKKIFVPNVDRNSALQNAQITGPIYIASDVTITKNTFPRQAAYADDVRDNGEVGRKTADYYLPSEEWKAIGNDAPFFACGENDPVKGTIGKSYKILSGSADKQYRLVGLGYYNPADYTPGATIPFNTWKHESATSEGRIPPYSYYLAGGKLYFNGKDGSTATKGLGFYLQVWEFDPVEVKIVDLNQANNTGPVAGRFSNNKHTYTSSEAEVEDSEIKVTGLKVESSTATLDGANDVYGQRVFTIKPSNYGATDVITITAPDGYLIDGYEIGGWYYTESEKYTLTAADGTTSVSINKKKSDSGANPPAYLKTSGLGVESTTITMTNSNTTNNRYACIPRFVVKLVAKTAKTASGSSTGAKVFAGNIGDFQWVEITPMSEGDDGSETNGITETYREFENPANDLYYDLQGRPVKTPRKNGIYIFHGKKIVY